LQPSPSTGLTRIVMHRDAVCRLSATAGTLSDPTMNWSDESFRPPSLGLICRQRTAIGARMPSRLG
jgi:hypothetical protein